MTLYDTLTKVERRIKNETITKVVKVNDGYVVFTCGYDGFAPLHEPYFFDRALSVSGFNMFDKANKKKLSTGKTVYKDSTPYRKGHKSGIRMDADNDGRERGGEETSDNGSGGGNTALPYGLCNKYGIQLPKGATPTQAWEALKDKTGISADKAYSELEKTGSAQSITPETSSNKSESNPQPTASETEEYKPTKGEKKVSVSKMQEAKDNLKSMQDAYNSDKQKYINGEIGYEQLQELTKNAYAKYKEIKHSPDFSNEEEKEFDKLKEEYHDLYYLYGDMRSCAYAVEKTISACKEIADSTYSADDKIKLIGQEADELEKFMFDHLTDEQLKEIVNKADSECRNMRKPFFEQAKVNKKAKDTAQENLSYMKVVWDKTVAESPLVPNGIESSVENLGKAQTGQVAIDKHQENEIYVKSNEGKWVNINTGEMLTDMGAYYRDLQLLSEDLRNKIIEDQKSQFDDVVASMNHSKIYCSHTIDYSTAVEIEEMYEKAKSDLDAIKQKKPKSSKTGKAKITGRTLTDTHGYRYSNDAYTKERRNNAVWCKSKDESAITLRSCTERAFKSADEGQCQAAYQYTEGSGHINRPLSGFNGSWDTKSYEGVGVVDLDCEGGAEEIQQLTELCGKNEFDTDMWMQRGFDDIGLAAFLGVDKVTEENVQKVMDEQSDCHYPGFMSCGAAKETGFCTDYIVNIYAPKGVKGVYVAPISRYGGDKEYRGKGAMKVGHENEILLQRDVHARVTKYERKGIQWYVDVEITSQDPVEYGTASEKFDSDNFVCYNLDANNEDIDWITMENGEHVPLKDGKAVGGPLEGKDFSHAKSEKKKSDKKEPKHYEITEKTAKGIKRIRNCQSASKSSRSSKMLAEREGLSKTYNIDIDQQIVDEFGETVITTKEFIEHCRNITKDWSDEDMLLDLAYTGSCFGFQDQIPWCTETLNKKLRSGEELSDDEQAVVAHFKRMATPAWKDMNLYRMVKPDMISAMCSSMGIDNPSDMFDREFTEKGLCSAAPGQNGFFGSCDVCMKIHVKSGQPICMTTDPCEGEIVIPAGAKFKITGFKEFATEDDGSIELPVWRSYKNEYYNGYNIYGMSFGDRSKHGKYSDEMTYDQKDMLGWKCFPSDSQNKGVVKARKDSGGYRKQYFIECEYID